MNFDCIQIHHHQAPTPERVPQALKKGHGTFPGPGPLTWPFWLGPSAGVLLARIASTKSTPRSARAGPGTATVSWCLAGHMGPYGAQPGTSLVLNKSHQFTNTINFSIIFWQLCSIRFKFHSARLFKSLLRSFNRSLQFPPSHGWSSTGPPHDPQSHHRIGRFRSSASRSTSNKDENSPSTVPAQHLSTCSLFWGIFSLKHRRLADTYTIVILCAFQYRAGMTVDIRWPFHPYFMCSMPSIGDFFA